MNDDFTSVIYLPYDNAVDNVPINTANTDLLLSLSFK